MGPLRPHSYSCLVFFSIHTIAQELLEQRMQNIRGLLESLIAYLSSSILSTAASYSATMPPIIRNKQSGRCEVTVKPQPTSKDIDYLLTRGVAQVEKEADLRRLLVEGNKGE